MPIRRNDSLIGDADLQALLDKFIEGTSVDEKGTLHFLHLDDDELYRILPDAFLADPALPDRQVRDLLRRALWGTRKAGDVTIETLTTRARLSTQSACD